MSADIFFRRDVANHISAAWQAVALTATISGGCDPLAFNLLRAYITALAVSFGIEPTTVLSDVSATKFIAGK